MRKHYGNYFKGIPDFKNHRIKLVSFNNVNELLETLREIMLIEQ
jgi:tRNA-dihydrouridine synthase